MRPVLGRLFAALIFALPLVSAEWAAAHHGWSSYDSSRPLALTGEVVEFRYENPHGHVRIDVDGEVWDVTLAPPSRMAARGLSGDGIEVGMTVSVEGYPSREHEGEMRAERITVDGETIELR